MFQRLYPRFYYWLVMNKNGIVNSEQFLVEGEGFSLHMESLKLKYAIQLNASWGLEIAGLDFGKAQTEDPKRKGSWCHEIRWCLKGESKRSEKRMRNWITIPFFLSTI